MKNYIYKFLFMMLAASVLFWACSPEEFELEKAVDKSSLDFSISQNPEDPNMVLLESLTPGAIPHWITPMGRSTKEVDTVLLPFAGSYQFIYSVLSGGGYVTGDTVTLELTTNNLSYVEDPLWTLLSGGQGNSKTWLLDLDADGVSKYWEGPMYFGGTQLTFEFGCEVTPAEEGDCWTWFPDWPGNSWIMPAADYGSMTFSLEGSATFTSNNPALGTSETGTYFLDADKHELSTTDAEILHGAPQDGVVADWGDLQLLSLTEDAMQIAALRDEQLSGEGPAVLIFNYISKDYSDNWVPEETEDPEPDLPDGWEDDISVKTDTELTWVLSPETPFNWTGLDGSFLNDWNSAEDYPDWAVFTAAAAANYENFSLTFNSADGSVEYVAPDGSSTEGTYTLSDGYFTFMGVTPSFTIADWVSLYTSDDNQWRVLRIKMDDLGDVIGMWVGVRDPVKPEYFAFHLELQTEAAPPDPLDPWKNALVGKTFKPDTEWFINWVGVSPDFSGGWTSSGIFGSDFDSNNWIYNEMTYNIAQSASITFTDEGDELGVSVSQTLYDADGNVVDADFTATGTAVIDVENKTLTFDIPLIDYTGSAAAWLETNGNDGLWYFVPHAGSNLSNVDSNGLWLGYGTPDNDSETTILHYIVE